MVHRSNGLKANCFIGNNAAADPQNDTDRLLDYPPTTNNLFQHKAARREHHLEDSRGHHHFTYG